MGGDGTRPSGADFPLPPPRPSGSSISTETPSRSSSDTSPSHTTGSEPSVRQHVIRRVSVRHRKTPSSFDRSIDISMMGGNGRDYCFFFFLIYVFSSKKKVERKRHILTSFVVFFSLKGGDFSEDARLLTPRRHFFGSFSSKKISIAKDKKNKQKKWRNIDCFLNSPYLFPSRI